MKRQTQALLRSLDPRCTALFAGGDVSFRLPRFNERWHRVALHMKIQRLLAQEYRVFLVESSTPFGRMALAELAHLRPGGTFKLWSLRLAGAPKLPFPEEDAPEGVLNTRWAAWRAQRRCDRRLGEVTPEAYDELLRTGVSVVVTPAEAALLPNALLNTPEPDSASDLCGPTP